MGRFPRPTRHQVDVDAPVADTVQLDAGDAVVDARHPGQRLEGRQDVDDDRRRRPLRQPPGHVQGRGAPSGITDRPGGTSLGTAAPSRFSASVMAAPRCSRSPWNTAEVWGVAPPRTLRSHPCGWSASRSRWTVTGLTSNSSAGAPTRTSPASATRSRTPDCRTVPGGARRRPGRLRRRLPRPGVGARAPRSPERRNTPSRGPHRAVGLAGPRWTVSGSASPRRGR